MRHYQTRLRAEGNLSYLEFIDRLKFIWEGVHPDIPVLPTQGQQDANYPCIVYGLELRTTHSNEPKMRFREEFVDRAGVEDSVLVYGQRYQNIVSFRVIDHDPRKAEEIIEAFEDFMLEQTGTFKKLGVSELVYNRRLSDSEENREGTDTSVRTVLYMLTTEKVRHISLARIEEILVDVRLHYGAIPEDEVDQSDQLSVSIGDLDQATPDS